MTKHSENTEPSNSTKPVLCDAFIDALPYTDEKIINKYTKQISKELVKLSKEFQAKGSYPSEEKVSLKENKINLMDKVEQLKRKYSVRF